MGTWQLQEAKNKFSELANLANRGEPQLVNKHGKPFVMVISAENYPNIPIANQPHETLADFFLSQPRLPEEWFANGADPFERIQGTLRETDFDCDPSDK